MLNSNSRFKKQFRTYRMPPTSVTDHQSDLIKSEQTILSDDSPNDLDQSQSGVSMRVQEEVV